MASSRIFVRNLPPNLTDDDFKKHFSKLSTPTDTRFFGPRRIGYVGYKTPDDAAKAVKYFNKSFIRMTKIAVEIARPVGFRDGIKQAPALTKKQATDDALPSRRKPQKESINAISTIPHDERVRTVVTETSKKRKRDSVTEQDADPKLKEFLKVMQPSKKSKTWRDEAIDETLAKVLEPLQEVPHATADSDDEYQSITKPNPRTKEQPASLSEMPVSTAIEDVQSSSVEGADEGEATGEQPEVPVEPQAAQSDADWLRNRTSRLLGLLDEEEEEQHLPGIAHDTESRSPQPQSQIDDDPQVTSDGKGTSHETEATLEPAPKADADADEEAIRKSKRLFLRNLPYGVNEDDLREAFEGIGHLEEVHISMDNKTGQAKGFGFALFDDADAAVGAWRKMDGSIFQGRLLHVLPAASKKENKLDDYEISRLPLKQQKLLQKKAEAASSTFNWNSLYMNQDAVVSSIAERLGISKSDVLDPTSSDAAVKQAFAETHVIQETKRYFVEHGVDLDAFKSKRRGDTAILVKNFPYGTRAEELRTMFQEYGKISRLLMPPSGTIAIIEFAIAPEARAAFKSLAYRKVKDSILFLEFAPRDLFKVSGTDGAVANNNGVVTPKPSAADLLQNDTVTDVVDTTTLFVKNLNFVTTSEKLNEAFAPLQGFISARVKTKPDPKKPGQTLSMGFGFVEFRTKENAQTTLTAMNGYALDGYKLELRPSQKAMDAAEQRRKDDKAKSLAAQKTKIIIKNLPFEASKKDVRALFGAYGQLRTVRVPKKFDHTSRGYAFAEFTSAREAANAIDALRNTHLLGRRLVLDFAAEEPDDPEAEIEKMQKKAGSEANTMAVQKLLGTGRKKFNVSGEEQDEA